MALGLVLAGPLHADRPDAVIELWEQHWTLNDDGSSSYYEKKHVRLNSDRAYGAFADPRITYDRDADELEIIAARVRRADGTYVAAPDYAHVLVGPGGSSGWPAFASITDHLVVMPAVEPGCVVELEYRLRRAARTALAGDLCLDQRYPVKRRVIVIQTPAETPARALLSGLAERPATRLGERLEAPGKAERRRWVFEDLPGVPDEPQAPPWQTWRPRLAFTTAGPADSWLKQRLAQLDGAATESQLVSRLARDWTADKTDPVEKLDALQSRLAATYNFVRFDASRRPERPRPAGQVANSNYGLPAEAAALLLALARAAGVSAQPALLVNDEVWSDEVPQRALVAGYAVASDQAGRPRFWHPEHGRIERCVRWNGCALVRDVGGTIARVVLPAWSDPDASGCLFRGAVEIARDGKYAGRLTLRTSGLFVPPEVRRSTDRQRRHIEALVHRLLPGAKVTQFTVTGLSADRFAAQVGLGRDRPLEKAAGAFRLSLAENGPFSSAVFLPLADARRRSPLRLAGAFDERIELSVQWPAGWSVEAVPQAIPTSRGEWGTVEQQVRTSEHGLTLVRHTRLAARDLSPESFLALRKPLNELRAAGCRTLLLRP